MHDLDDLLKQEKEANDILDEYISRILKNEE